MPAFNGIQKAKTIVNYFKSEIVESINTETRGRFVNKRIIP